MAFGDLLEQVGSMGRYQILHVTLLCVPILMMASQNILQNFVAMVPPHQCSTHTNLSEHRLSPEEALLVTVPLDHQANPHKCQRYAAPQWHLLNRTGTSRPEEEEDSVEDYSAPLQGCLDGWTYNMTERTSTIISDWDLVCERRPLKEMAQTIYMSGVLVGAAVFGGLSDRFGRRKLLIFSYLLMAVMGTCVAFAPSLSLFCLFRFGCGMALSGLVLNSFSLIVEWTPTRWRTLVGTVTGYSYTIGQLILAMTAYFIRDWRWLALAVSLPFYVVLFYSWWFLESARWLALKNNSKQAVKNLQTVAKFNGLSEEAEKINITMLEESMKKELSCSKGSYTMLDLVRTPTMRNMTLCLFAVWFSTSFAYYALSMDLQKFGVNIYLIQVIFGSVDIPAKVIITVSMTFLGRRISQACALILSGVSIWINLLVPYDRQILRTCLAVLGKGCLAASFNCCYLYSGELYPTVIRQNGLGCVSMMARIGAMVAPMASLLGDYIPWLPGVIYGAAPILSGVAALFLPETLNIALPDTIQDVEDRGRELKETKSKNNISLQQPDTQTEPLKETA